MRLVTNMSTPHTHPFRLRFGVACTLEPQDKNRTKQMNAHQTKCEEEKIARRQQNVDIRLRAHFNNDFQSLFFLSLLEKLTIK